MRASIPVSFEQLYITEQGLLQTETFSAQIEGRERQFLLLLLRDDKISRQAGTALLAEVNVGSLIARGFISKDKSDAVSGWSHTDTNDNESHDNNMNTSTDVVNIDIDKVPQYKPLSTDYKRTTVPDDNEAIDPILKLAAGTA